ncbi:MAG: 4-hydroxybenzoate octaprenyltransferase [SAR116 cluster bacterium]|nr:4-hydroxybenzoate octaprenyltransferase [SAR116 cluster bacterium]
MNTPKTNNSDMVENGWWDALPNNYIKWIRLGRFDRPVGFWLLLLPGWWVLPLTNLSLLECLKIMFIFLIGSIVMRAAGCTINDLWDKDIDKKITRTKNRPLAKGDISVNQALVFLLIMSLIGLICLYQLNTKTWFVAISAIPLIIIYPLAKRFTKWPQVVLGLTFSWAVPTAWASASENWNLGIILIYFATVFWIIGYDTIYGCQDKNEDEKFGVKNSAVSAKNFLSAFVSISYILCFILLILGGYFLQANYFWFLGVMICGLHLLFQVIKLQDLNKNHPLKIFKSNVHLGLLLTIFSLSNHISY